MACGIALAATSAYLISKAAIVSDIAGLSLAFTSVRLFAVSRAAFRYLERLISHTATFRVSAHLRSWFYAAIEPVAPARLTDYRSGDLLTRSVADIQTLESFYIRVVVPPIAAVMVAGFAFILLGAIYPVLAVSMIMFLFIVGVVLPIGSRWIEADTSRHLVEMRAEFNACAVDQVQGLADLLIFDRTDKHRDNLISLSHRMDKAQERLAFMRGLNNGAGTLLATLAALIALSISIALVRAGRVDGVYLALIVLVTLATFEAVQPLPVALQQFEASQTGAGRVFELIDAPSPFRSSAREPMHRLHFGIEFRNVVFRYETDGPVVLDRLSFSLASGQRLAFKGESGSGKSTIVSLLLRFWEYESGEILVGGRDLRNYGPDDLRSLISVAPQDIHLFNGTLRDNLLVANPDLTDAEISAACTQALLGDFLARLPDGYDTLVGENGLMLSAGERQRLAIARMVLKDAPIVILDEPTTSLDTVTEEGVMQSLEPFLQGRTVLIISHRAAVTAHAGEVLELAEGRVMAMDDAAA